MVKGNGVAKTDVIKCNYHPDYHSAQDLGCVKTMMMPLVPDGKCCLVCSQTLVSAVGEHMCPDLRLVGVVQVCVCMCT